jgi:signal transduction histidine kinase
MPGSGLGLAIVEQVARTHGGTVTVARAPDDGTLVDLRFPAVARAEFS